MGGSITASCGHVLKDGEDVVSVRIGGEDCDAIDGFAPSVSYHSYCPSCATEARSWDTFLADGVTDEWWFETGYPAWRAKAALADQST